MDETNLDTEWKCNIALEEIEKKFENSYTVSGDGLIEAGPMIWTALRPLTMPQNVRPKEDIEDKNTLTTH